MRAVNFVRSLWMNFVYGPFIGPLMKMIALVLWPVSKAIEILMAPIYRFFEGFARRLVPVGFFDDRYADNEDALLRGDIPAAAEQHWPKSEYPTFYMRIPDEMRRSIISDGRIRGSSKFPIDVLPPGAINSQLVEDAKTQAIRVGVRVFVLSFIAIFIYAVYTKVVPIFGADLPTFTRTGDAWSDWDIIIQKASFYTTTWAGFIAKMFLAATASIALLATTSFVLATTLGMTTFWGLWRRLIIGAADKEAEHLRLETKEAIVRWKQRQELRDMELEAYHAQLKEIKRVNSPVISVGRATGLFHFRGMLSCPLQRQPVQASIEDLFQNTVILGGTGSGKTFALISPMAAQLIKLQDSMDMSLYITDSKGVLWRDIADIATKFGKPIQVIGVGEGEVGIDLLEGVEPSVAASLIHTVLKQSNGGYAGDDFWPSMATTAIRHCLVLCNAWERTDGGLKYAENTGERPYSLVTVYKLLMQARKLNGLAKTVVEDILSTIENEFQRIGDLATTELYGSIEYIRDTWPDMAKDTRSGIEQNVVNVLGKFDTNVMMRKRFGSGEDAEFVMDDCFGRKITCVNLPDDVLGATAKVVNVFLKTLLFRKAMQRQALDANIRDKQQLAFIGDEYQSLITADTNSISDATFPNKSRSTGVFYIVATQGVNALEQSIGEYATHNFMNNMRSKIFATIEEGKTMDFAKRLAGKTLRFYSYDEESHESHESKRRELGLDPSKLMPGWLRDQDRNIGPLKGLWVAIMSLFDIELRGMRKKYETETLPALYSQDTVGDQNADRNRQAQWRTEDRNSEYMKAGNEFHDVLSDADLIQMGRQHAYAFIMRGGHARQDIIRLSGINEVMKELRPI